MAEQHGIRVKLRCACGAEAEFETLTNFYVKEFRDEAQAWQKRHDGCLVKTSKPVVP